MTLRILAATIAATASPKEALDALYSYFCREGFPETGGHLFRLFDQKEGRADTQNDQAPGPTPGISGSMD